jgi:hypothetical protein
MPIHPSWIIAKKPKRQPKPRSYRYTKPFSHVYQLKIALKGIEPLIWRRIQVPDSYTFWDLHCAITDAFGWLDYHLHQFTIHNPKGGNGEYIGLPNEDRFEDEVKVLPGWKHKISHYFSMEHPECDYAYDFGDDWHHAVVLEGILPKEADAIYPRCIVGGNACPPEDCGGDGGYQNFLEAIADPQAEEHESMLEWVGGWFDPAWFDLSLIIFENPDVRYAIAFTGKPVPASMRVVQYHQMRQGSEPGP